MLFHAAMIELIRLNQLGLRSVYSVFSSCSIFKKKIKLVQLETAVNHTDSASANLGIVRVLPVRGGPQLPMELFLLIKFVNSSLVVVVLL